MKHDIAFLHTAAVHQPTFEKLMREAAPGLSVRHLVREDLLARLGITALSSPSLGVEQAVALHSTISDR